MPADSGTEGRNSLGSRSAAVRRYWWAVAAVVVLAVLGALLATLTAPTTYTGRTSLIVSSNDRSPEQDAVLVQGYASYFDNEAYQQQLLAEAGVNNDAELTAQAAAASPILVITATAADGTSAQAAAIAVARAFKDDINEVHSRTTAAALATLQDQLDTALARNSKDDQAVIASLQDRISQLQGDQDNILQELQTQGGASAEPPSLLNNLVLGFVGGVFFGALLALTLAKFSPRLRSRHDVAEKIGLNTLIELPLQGPNSAPERERRLRQLANVLRARLAGPGVVAVTQPSDGASAWVVAHGLAVEWAGQGYATVLVRLSGGVESPSMRSDNVLDLVKPAEPSSALSRMRPGPVPGMSVLDMRLRLVGGATTLPAARVSDLLRLDPLVGSFVVIETSAVVSSAAAQAASLAADATILVIDTQVAKVKQTREAVEVLRQAGVEPLASVLAPGCDEEGDENSLDETTTGQPGTNRPSETSSTGWSW